MSSHNAAHIEARLIAAGRSGNTPIIIAENAGRAYARAIKGTLSELAMRVTEAAYDGPVLIGVGEAFRFARMSAATTLSEWPKVQTA